MPTIQEYMDQYAAARAATEGPAKVTYTPIPTAPVPTKDPSLLRRAGDFGVDVLKAVPTLVEAGAGLAGMVPGLHYAADPVGQFAGGVAEGLGKKLYSGKRLEEEAAIQQRMATVQDAGLMTQAKTAAEAYTDNPYALLGMVGQSLGLAKGGAVAGKALLSGVGKPVATGGVVNAGRAATAAQVGEGLVAGGLVASTAAQENPDEFAARYYGLPAGALTTLISRGANKLMPDTADVDVLLAGGARPVTAGGVVGTAKNVGKMAFKEGVLEEALQSGQEQVFTNAATDQPLLRGVGGAMASGAMAGSVMGGMFGFKQRKPAGTVTNDDLIADVDEVLAPPAQPTEPLQAEYEQAQREFELANQPQGSRYPEMAKASSEELQQMDAWLASERGRAVAGAEDIRAAIAQELQDRAAVVEPTLEQRNDALITAAMGSVDPTAALAGPPEDVTMQADWDQMQQAQRAQIDRAARERQIAEEQQARAASVPSEGVRAAQAADRTINLLEGRDMFGDFTPQAEPTAMAKQEVALTKQLDMLENRAVEGVATPQEMVEMQQLRDKLTPKAAATIGASTADFVKQYMPRKTQVSAKLAAVPIDQLPDALAAQMQRPGATGRNYAPVLAQMYADLTGGLDIQNHASLQARQASAALQGFEEAPTQGRIENVQGALKAVPRLPMAQQRANMRATEASAAAGQAPAAPLGANIPEVSDAVQKPVTAKVDVRQPAKAGRQVAKGDTQKAPPAKGQTAKGEVNVQAAAVAEPGRKGASDIAPTSTRAGEAEQGDTGRVVRGRTGTPSTGDTGAVAVGDARGERAAGVAPEAVSPFAKQETRDLELSGYKKAYLDLVKPAGMSREAFTKKKAEYLQSIAEMERNADSTASRKGAKNFLEEQAKFDPAAVKMARRKAESAVKLVEDVEAKLTERNKRIAEKQAAWEAQLQEFDDTQKKRSRTDKQLENALKGKASGADAVPDNPNAHTMRSLAEALVEHFGEGMRGAILAGRVKLVADQTHLAAETGDTSRRGKLTQGMYYYNPKAPAGSGTVYFVAANLAKNQQGYTAFDVALHEIGEHAGMEQMLGKQNYAKLMSSLRKAMAVQTPKTQFEKDVAAAKKKLLTDQQGQPHEVLAYMIQHTPDSTGLQKMWAAIKAFAARFGLLPDSMKDAATMRALAEGAAARWLKGVAGVSARVTGKQQGAASGINNPEMRTVFTNFGEAANAAKQVLGKVEGMKGIEPQNIGLKAFKLLASWITKHHMVAQYDKWFKGALAKNAEADTIQQATSARVAQLFNEPYNRLKALPQELQEKVGKLMELTEMKLDPRKGWDAHTHLHALTGDALSQAKKYHNDGRQRWGQLGASTQGKVAQGVYTDLAAMNEALYTMEMAVSTYNMVHANAGPAKDLPTFKADPTEKFRQSTAVHGSIEAAHTYWKGVLEGYNDVLNTHVAEQRGLLPVKSAIDPEVAAAERKMLKGVQNEKVRRTIRAQLRTRTDTLNDEQKKILRHLSPLEAQLRVSAETVETFKHAPYFHLGRFGDQFVSFRVRAGEDGVADPAAMKHVQQVLAKAFPDVSIRTDATDPHIFARFESVDQASAFVEYAEQLQKDGWLMRVGTKDKNNKDLGEIQHSARQEIIAGYHTAGPNWLSRVVEGIQAEGFDDEVTKQMVASVRSMYLDSLPDTAAIKVKQRREGVPGWHRDMMRNYAHRMRVGANRVASLAAEPTRTQSFADMNDVMAQAKTDRKISVLQRNKMAVLVSEMQKRNSNQMSVPHTPTVDMLRAVNHAYFLGMSPSYLLIQMTQVGVLTWPELAKKHGFVKSAKALGEVTGIALKVVGAVLREGFARQGLKGAADMVITGDMLERAGLAKSDAEFLVKIMAAGKLDIGNAARNVGRVAEGETGSEALKIATAMGYASEVLTRTITALAAKRLHKGDGVEKYAINVIDEAMLDYTIDNEGRMMGKQGVIGAASPVMFSFMKYQAQLLEKMYREVYTAYSKTATPEQKAEARKFLGGHLAAMMTLAGTLGMPFATVIAAAADKLCDAFGEGYCDSKIAMRNMTAEVFGHDIEPLLSKGALPRLFGYDISDRAGEANILPFSKFLADKRSMDERLQAMATDAWGAPTAMVGNILKAHEKIWQGDLLGAMQEGVPLALKGPIKAYEMSEKGYTDKSGKVLPMTPGAHDMLLQAIGLNPGEKADYQQAKFAQSQRAGVLGREATLIRNKLASAIEQGDRGAMRDWLEKAREYDTENPGRGILATMAATMQQRARAGATATATGMPLGVSPKDIGAQQLTTFMQPR